MKPPDLLGAPADSAALKTPDEYLVRYKGLKAWLARLFWFIPSPGSGITVTMTADGPRWSATGSSGTLRPFQIDPTTRKLVPGNIGGMVPTYNGIALNSASVGTFALSGTYSVWAKLTFAVTYDSVGYLTAWPLSSVEIQTTGGSATASVKFLLLTTVTAGVPGPSSFNGSVSVTLCDAGVDTTSLSYNSA